VAAEPVEAVFVVFYGLTAHKATYGRHVNDTSYTKDYIQLIQDGDFREVLERMFPRKNPGAKATEIEYRWPGGSSEGSVEFESADRPHLAWRKTVEAPRPWRMTPDPADHGPQTIPGDPTATDPSVATAQFEKLRELGIHPYLIAVKLKNEPDVLHVRAYIKSPPEEYSFADTALLPVQVKALVDSATNNRAFKWALFDSHAAIMTPDIAVAIERLAENPALLLTGPPGTGKTVLLESLANFVENPGRGILFDPDKNHDAWVEVTDALPGKARSIVLHPGYSYDNLVLGLLPEPTAAGGVGVKVVTGPLVNLAHYASQAGRRALLVLDEFNRTNAAGVLGDALALLDKDKRGKAYIDLPYGNIDIRVPEEFKANGSTQVNPRFTLPPSLWVVAAMNTSDRSVAPLDAALRRRFTIVEMGPDYDLLAQQLAADDDADLQADADKWTIGHVGKLAVALLRALNHRIDMVLGPDFRLGHSNFWQVDGETTEAALRSLTSAFDHRIVQTLRLSLQDDDGALAAILRAGSSDQPFVSNSSTAWWEKPDSELGTFASDRLHLRVLSSLPPAKALAEMRRQAGL
jgi:5-methylcytosine-specific restriction enzyme B